MQVTLTVRHGDAPETIKQFAQDEVEGLGKYFDRLVEANIILDQQGHRHIVEVRLHASNDTHFASAERGDFRTAVDETIEKLRRQVERRKGKLEGRPLSREEREQRFGAVGGSTAEGGGAEAPPAGWDRITSEEAVARLRGSGEDVLVFVDSEDGVVKIARQGGEGGIDVVEPEAFEIEER